MSEWIKHTDMESGKFGVNGKYYRENNYVQCDFETQDIDFKEMINSLPYAPDKNTLRIFHENGRTYIVYRILEPQQTTLDYQIEVMQAYRDGAEIEVGYYGESIWNTQPTPTWNWVKYNYRIKQKPKTRTMPDGTELPLPVMSEKGLDEYRTYYIIDPAQIKGYSDNMGRWEGGSFELQMLKKGLIFTDESDAKKVADYIINKVLKVK